MFIVHLIHVVLRVGTWLRVRSVLRLLDQLSLKFTYRPLLQEVMFMLLEVMLLLLGHISLLLVCIFLLPKRIFLPIECLMGHRMQ